MRTDERRLRLLLRAYPRAYRRRHGTEIVTTLLEAAEAGGGRLGFGQALHLVACGVRQRFRLPRRPLALIAAVLAAVALGGLGTVAGTWLGWQTAATVPSTAEAGALATAATGLPWPSVEPWRTAMGGPGVNSLISGTDTYDAGRVRTDLRLDITADANGAIRPLTIAGLLVGALAGWLVSAALTYRRPRRWPVSALSAVALAATGVPAFVACCKTYSDGIPPTLVLVTLAVAVLGLAGATVASRRGEPQTAALQEPA
jgi:hypothetical protein